MTNTTIELNNRLPASKPEAYPSYQTKFDRVIQKVRDFSAINTVVMQKQLRTYVYTQFLRSSSSEPTAAARNRAVTNTEKIISNVMILGIYTEDPIHKGMLLSSYQNSHTSKREIAFRQENLIIPYFQSFLDYNSKSHIRYIKPFAASIESLQYVIRKKAYSMTVMPWQTKNESKEENIEKLVEIFKCENRVNTIQNPAKLKFVQDSVADLNSIYIFRSETIFRELLFINRGLIDRPFREFYSVDERSLKTVYTVPRFVRLVID